VPLLPCPPSPCPMQGTLRCLCCRGVPCPGRARATAPQDPQHQGRSWPETAAGSSPGSHPSHPGRGTPGRCPSQGPGRQESPGKSLGERPHHPAQYPSPAWQQARAHLPWVPGPGAAHPGSPPRWVARAGWGLPTCCPAAGLRRSGLRPTGTARVDRTPRFESVQEAAYQRSCCLCRFLSLLLPHPACRPHTYRPHRRSSAAAPAPLPGPEPLSCARGHGPGSPEIPGCLLGHLRYGRWGVLGALCHRPWPMSLPAHGAWRDGRDLAVGLGPLAARSRWGA